MSDETMRRLLAETTSELNGLETEIAQLSETIARLTGKADTLRRVRNDLESYFEGGDESEAEEDAPEGPRGKAAVRLVLADRPNKGMSVADIAAEMVKRGWVEDNDRTTEAVRTSCYRAAGDKKHPEIQKYRRGLFIYRTPKPTTVAGVPENAESPAQAGLSDLHQSHGGGDFSAPSVMSE